MDRDDFTECEDRTDEAMTDGEEAEYEVWLEHQHDLRGKR